MDFGPPLSYESLKTVLQHMDPNLRIRLSINCPSIRLAEKAVPLKIKELELSDKCFAIDEIKYAIFIYQKYPAGTCPTCVKNLNVYGGPNTKLIPTDLDVHGYNDWPSRLKLRPGDVDLIDPNERRNIEPIEVGEDETKERERELPELQERLDYVESLGPIMNSEADESYSQPMLEEIMWYFVLEKTSEERSAHYSRQTEFEHARAEAYEELKDNVLYSKAAIKQWYARRDGLPVPFESYIKINIFNKYTLESKNIEFVKYEKSLFEAFNYLMHRIFENRRCPVAIKVLVPFSGIIRLTPGLRMQIEEMHFDGEADRAFTELAPYIEESSYPLKCLKIIVWDTAVFQHPKLRSAKHLVVDRSPAEIRWLPILLNLENHNVQMMVDYFEGTMPVDDFMVLIRHWASCGKELGASFCFALQVEEDELEMDDFHKDVFKRIKTQIKEAVSGYKYAKIRTDNGTTLKVSVERSGDVDDPWILVMHILPLEH